METRKWKYVCISQGWGGYFGFGNTVDDAKKQYKAEGGKLTDRWAVYALPEYAVNPRVAYYTGQIQWDWEQGTPEDIKNRPIVLETVVKRG